MALLKRPDILHARRTALGLSIRQLALKVGVHPSFIGNMEKGLEPACTDDTARRIDKVLSRRAVEGKYRRDSEAFGFSIWDLNPPVRPSATAKNDDGLFMSSLSEADVREIVRGYESSEPVRQLADRFNVTPATVRRHLMVRGVWRPRTYRKATP